MQTSKIKGCSRWDVSLGSLLIDFLTKLAKMNETDALVDALGHAKESQKVKDLRRKTLDYNIRLHLSNIYDRQQTAMMPAPSSRLVASVATTTPLLFPQSDLILMDPKATGKKVPKFSTLPKNILYLKD
jgi:hypothetical protein